jgi:hypothetical protein
MRQPTNQEDARLLLSITKFEGDGGEGGYRLA